MTARPHLDDRDPPCGTCDGFGWNYDRLGARITCSDCSGANVRRERPPTAHCATCNCGVGEEIPRPSVSSKWARRQAKEAAAAAIRAAKDRRLHDRVTAGHADNATSEEQQ